MTDRKRRDERKRKRRERAENATDVAGAAGETGCSRVGCDRGGGRRGGCSGCDGCDGCDGPSGCDLLLVRLSTVLTLAAALAPAAGADRVVLALIGGYRRWLTRYTPRCPATPSCSTYALLAVRTLGPRHGLAAAARRISECGSGGRAGGR